MRTVKIALVTGSSRGLGFEVAKQLAVKGYQILLTGRNPMPLNLAVQQIGPEGFHKSFCLDLTDPALLQDFIVELKDRALDPCCIVHCLGGVIMGDAQPLTVDVLRQSLQLNLEVALELNKAFLPKMCEQQYGRIIHISSDASLTGNSAPGYAAAKAAINAYVKSAARFYAKDKVMLCAVLPGIFEHEGSAWAKKKESAPEHYQKRLEQMPLGRFAFPGEVASFIVDLICNESMMSAGSLLELSGGF